MSREILLLVDALAREKTVEKEIVFTALEMALASATKKRFNEDVDTCVSIDRETGDYQSYRRWIVVADDELEDPIRQVPLSEAQNEDVSIELGGFRQELLEPVEFGRIGAQAAKQVIFQKIRDAERELSSGRNSRLSMVLNSLDGVDVGELFDAESADLSLFSSDEIKKLGLLF